MDIPMNATGAAVACADSMDRPLVSPLTLAQKSLIALLLAAAVVYCLNLQRALGASEAYSALAASQPSVRLIARSAMSLDPGKPVLYHLTLHYFSACFGAGEVSLRALSVIFALIALVLLYLLADELFGPAVAISAASIWAFNPVAVLFAQWARMYSMFIALALGHLLLMAKLRREPNPARMVACGVLGGAMLYTHLGGVLILAAEAAMVVRDFWRRGKSNVWPAVAIAAALFSPFIPTAVSESRSLLFGHWLDWIGARPRESSLAVKAVFLAAFGASGLWLVFARRSADERSEALRWCAAIALIPIALMVAGCVVVRPMFQIRYLAPCWALLAILVAYAFNTRSEWFRRMGVLTTAGILLAWVPMYQNARHEPWREVAHQIETKSSGPAEPVVFEAGFFSPDGTIGGPVSGFPQGYYRVPFDFYFRAANRRTTVPASDLAQARKQIEDEVRKNSGVWLISGKNLSEAINEVPATPDVAVVSESEYQDVVVLHLKRVGT